MATEFARGTRITEDRSRSTIEGLLRRRGATNITAGRVEHPHVPRGRVPHAWIGCVLGGRALLLRFPLPSPEDPKLNLQRSGRPRAPMAVVETCERIIRARWRALLLVIRAKFAAIDAEVSTFDTEFFGDFATGDGRTVADLILPRLGNEQTIAPALLASGDE